MAEKGCLCAGFQLDACVHAARLTVFVLLSTFWGDNADAPVAASDARSANSRSLAGQRMMNRELCAAAISCGPHPLLDCAAEARVAQCATVASSDEIDGGATAV